MENKPLPGGFTVSDKVDQQFWLQPLTFIINCFIMEMRLVIRGERF